MSARFFSVNKLTSKALCPQPFYYKTEKKNIKAHQAATLPRSVCAGNLLKRKQTV